MKNMAEKGELIVKMRLLFLKIDKTKDVEG